ncbi:hypothetical protein Zm00014a_017847 [Zea mays]|uniref:Uncharacterized protein n=1 Tax=Zea mays TaxID=4577 RepID=A0A3L6DYD5_MAIZE|nr:hypothetical protein Zm00014a_017847 [Zea mays]
MARSRRPGAPARRGSSAPTPPSRAVRPRLSLPRAPSRRGSPAPTRSASVPGVASVARSRGPAHGAACPYPGAASPALPRCSPTPAWLPPHDLAPAPARPWRARPARGPCSRRSAACPRPARLPSPGHRPGVLAMARRASASAVVARPGPCPCTAWPLRSAAPGPAARLRLTRSRRPCVARYTGRLLLFLLQ